MSDKIKVEVDASGALAVMRELSPEMMDRAWRRTLRKTGVWIKSQTAKAVSKETKIPQKVLRARINYYSKWNATGKVWLGLNPLEAHKIAYGQAHNAGRGVTVGRNRFPGAWMMPVRAGQAGQRRYTGKEIVMQRIGKSRLPIEKVMFDWEQSGRKSLEIVAERVKERLMVILEQEVNYEIQKAIGNAR